MTAEAKKQKSRLFSIFDGIGSAPRLRAEKARLEAFLSAVPGEYCGWAADGSIAYSGGFCDALGLSVIESFVDIQNALCADDAPALESLFNRLTVAGIAFTMNAQTRQSEKLLKISGTRGQDLDGNDTFHILWLEDISDMAAASAVMEEEQSAIRRESETMQDSLDALPYPVWLRDEAQKLTWCNVAYAKALSDKPSEIIAQQKEVIAPPRKKKDAEKIIVGAELAALALKSKKTQSSKVHTVIDGKRVWVKISEIPILSRGMTLGMAEDLSEEEQALDAVKNNQSAYRALMEQMRSAIGVFAADQSLEFYNSSFSQLWGLEEGWLNTNPTLGDIMEKLRETRMLPEQADFRSFKKSWLDMFTGLIQPSEDMLYLPDGSALRMLTVPHKLGGLMMTFEDVTSRLELESSYNTLIAVQKETLDNLAEGVAVYAGNGRLKLWNPSFAAMWSLNPESLEGEPHITKIAEKMEAAFDAGGTGNMKERLIAMALDRSMLEGRLEPKSGDLIEYATVPLPDGGVMITYTDVTDTVRVEKALREKNAALEAAEQLKMDFLANVSYQLRTPLSAIMGFNEMLDQEFFGPLNEKQKEYTRDIHGASERLLNLINDILDLSTIEAGQMDLEIGKTSVYAMMNSVHELVTDWARKDSVEVTLKCPKNIGQAMLDESRIKQALIYLVRNSIAHTDEGGRIELICSRSSDKIKIIVKDNGEGIAKADQKRILQPFERIEGSSNARGAGLGLTLVRNIVGLHGGAFTLQSEQGEGTQITLTLPRGDEAARKEG